MAWRPASGVMRGTVQRVTFFVGQTIHFHMKNVQVWPIHAISLGNMHDLLSKSELEKPTRVPFFLWCLLHGAYFWKNCRFQEENAIFAVLRVRAPCTVLAQMTGSGSCQSVSPSSVLRVQVQVWS